MPVRVHLEYFSRNRGCLRVGHPPNMPLAVFDHVEPPQSEMRRTARGITVFCEMCFAAFHILNVFQPRELSHRPQNLNDHVPDRVLIVERFLVVKNGNTALSKFLCCDV